MKNIILLWQRIHFNIFEFNKFTQIKVFGLPVLLLLRNKFVIKAYQKRGVHNPEKVVRDALINNKNSTILTLSDGCMVILVALIIFTIANLLSAIFGFVLMAKLNAFLFLMVCLVPSLVIVYFLIWKDDKYLDYFKEYESEPKEIKRKWVWVSFGVIVGIILLLVLSFIIMTEALN